MHTTRNLNNKFEILSFKRKEGEPEDLLKRSIFLISSILEEKYNEVVNSKEQIINAILYKVSPCLESLKNTPLTKEQSEYISGIEEGLYNSVLPYRKKMSNLITLSYKQMEVAKLIREGKKNKEIASILNMSYSTVITHRHIIRKKLGLRFEKKNLRTFLRTFGL
jgi:DNA-binding CsgD family transcriptional regulator